MFCLKIDSKTMHIPYLSRTDFVRIFWWMAWVVPTHHPLAETSVWWSALEQDHFAVENCHRADGSSGNCKNSENHWILPDCNGLEGLEPWLSRRTALVIAGRQDWSPFGLFIAWRFCQWSNRPPLACILILVKQAKRIWMVGSLPSICSSSQW